ncbi:influenza virus NS1A-binding protein homolog [Diadema setosum]|uniref:influenza virus NS1A-binding protein homolog n=1 Tax=Diadema setosum TaxID=31175 RepID=UPI003B3A8C4C
MINNNTRDDDLVQMKTKLSETRLQYSEDQWPASVLAYMNEMRKQHQTHDMVLLTNEHEVPAHAAVLACMSPIFSETVSREEKRRSGILKTTVEGVSAAAVEALVNFAYTGKLEVSSDLVSEVYHTTKVWKVPRLKKACATHLLDNMNTRNCLEIRSLANSENDTELVSITDKYIKANVDEVTGTPDFAQLPVMKLEVISSKASVSMSDRQIFESAVDWVRKTVKGGVELSELMEQPQTLLLSANNILKNIKEVDELESEVMDTYDIDLSEVGVYTPDKKKVRNGHQNGAGAGGKGQGGGHTPTGSANTTPRKLILAPGDAPKQSQVMDSWKVIASTSMADNRYVALVVLDNQLTTLVLYEKPKHKHRPARSFSIEKDALHPPLAAMNYPRSASGVTELNGKIIVAGGYDRGKFHSSTEAFDPVTNKWELLRPMSTPRGRFQLSQLNGFLYVAGGSNGNCELKSCESYDTLNDWTSTPEMPLPRTCYGATVLNGQLYIIGGASGSSNLKSCLRYDPSSSTWSDIAPLTEGRAQVGVCSMSGKIYAVGGSDSWNCYNSVEVYQPEENKWRSIAPMKSCRRGAGTCTVDGKMYAIGGSDGQMVLDTVECYDPETEEWAPAASMSTPRVNVGVGVADGKIYAIGGFSGKRFLDSVEMYNPNNNRWYQVARHLRVPATSSPPLSPLLSMNGSEDDGAFHSNGKDMPASVPITNGKDASSKPHPNHTDAPTLPVA